MFLKFCLGLRLNSAEYLGVLSVFGPVNGVEKSCLSSSLLGRLTQETLLMRFVTIAIWHSGHKS